MAVPKRKHSSARRDKRRAANNHLTAPTLVKCNHCGELKAPHRICDMCGTYKDRDYSEVL